MVTLRTPVEIESVGQSIYRTGLGLACSQILAKELDSTLTTEKSRKNLQLIASSFKPKLSIIRWQKEVVVRGYPRFTDKEATPSLEFIVTIHPDIEILPGLPPRQGSEEMLNNPTTLGV